MAAVSADTPAPPADYMVPDAVTTAPPSDNKADAAATPLENGGASADVATNGQNPKKDRKPRRQGLPLPDPLPEKPVARYAEPSKATMHEKVSEEETKIQQCFDNLNATRKFFDQRQKVREASKPDLDIARKTLNELNEQIRNMFEERKALSAQLKSIKDAEVAARGSHSSSVEMPGVGKDGNEALRNIHTMEELDEKIESLQYQHQTESVSMSAERKLVHLISFLNHKGRDHIRKKDQSFKDEKVAKEARATSKKTLEDNRRDLDKRIDEVKVQLDAQKKTLDDLRAKQDEEIKKLQDDVDPIDRDEEKKKITECRTAIRQIREEFQNELDQWYLNERILVEQQRATKRKRYEAIQAQRDARRKAWEAEQAEYPEPHPYQAEKDMCSSLTVYMQTLLGEEVEKPSVNLRGGDSAAAPSLKSTAAAREITASGTKIGKSSASTEGSFGDLAFAGFVNKKSGKSKNKKGRRASPTATEETNGDNATLKPVPIDLLTAFSKLGISAPKKMSDVRTALEAVKAKSEFYETAPAPTQEQQAERDNKPKKPQMPAAKKTDGAELMNGDAGAAAFPGLRSESGPVPAPARDSNLPSFKAVASGVAAAPVPVVVSADLGLMKADLDLIVEVDAVNSESAVPDGDVPTDVGGDDAVMGASEPEPSMAEA